MTARTLHNVFGSGVACPEGHKLFKQSYDLHLPRKYCSMQMKCSGCNTYTAKQRNYFCSRCNYYLCSFCYEKESVDLRNHGIGIIKYQATPRQYIKMTDKQIRTIYGPSTPKEPKPIYRQPSPWDISGYKSFNGFHQTLEYIKQMDLSRSWKAIFLIIKIIETEVSNHVKFDQYRYHSLRKEINSSKLNKKLYKYVQDKFVIFISLLAMLGFSYKDYGKFTNSWYTIAGLKYYWLYTYHELRAHIGENYKVILGKHDVFKDDYKGRYEVEKQLLMNVPWFVVKGYCLQFLDRLGMDIIQIIYEFCALQSRYLSYSESGDNMKLYGIRCLLQQNVDYIECMMVIKVGENRYIYGGCANNIHYYYYTHNDIKMHPHLC